MTSKQKKFNFTEAFNELEKITEKFESGNTDLDQGLQEFERGLTLANELKKKLQEVENKVRIIKAKFKDLEEVKETEEETQSDN